MKKTPKPTSPRPIPVEDRLRRGLRHKAPPRAAVALLGASPSHSFPTLSKGFPPAKTLGRRLGSLKPLRAAEHRLKPQGKHKWEGHLFHLPEQLHKGRGFWERLEMLRQAARSRHLPARLSSCKAGAESEGRAGPTALLPLQSPPQHQHPPGRSTHIPSRLPPCSPHHGGLHSIVPSPLPRCPQPAASSPGTTPRCIPHPAEHPRGHRLPAYAGSRSESPSCCRGAG